MAFSGTHPKAAETTRVDSEVEREILRAITGIRYGSVEIIVHNGRVVQIERTEKIRLAQDSEDAANGTVRAVRSKSE